MALLFSATAHGLGGPFLKKDFPQDVCNETFCSPQQKTIWQAMKISDRGLKDLVLPSVYSGSCFWEGAYDPTTEHHAGFIFDGTRGLTTMHGEFSFFSTENPYLNLDVATAREQWKSTAPPFFYFEHHPSYSFLDLNLGGEDPLWYWVRFDQTNPDQMYLLAYWGNSNIGLCTFRKNE